MWPARGALTKLDETVATSSPEVTHWTILADDQKSKPRMSTWQAGHVDLATHA
jgi:hypothetical protein